MLLYDVAAFATISTTTHHVMVDDSVGTEFVGRFMVG
jgi:hypothetical protein